MNQLSHFLESGMLELYVLGNTTTEQAAEVEQMAANHPEIREELDAITLALEQFAGSHAVKSRSTVKPLLMATIDYMERVKKGEVVDFPPLLSPQAKIADYAEWLNREEFQAPAEIDGAYARLIGVTHEATTAIVWIKNMTEYEVHHDEHESFLIVEGTCDFIVGDDVYKLVPGDYIAVPLHKPHMARVTSEVPCKAILQRIAA